MMLAVNGCGGKSKKKVAFVISTLTGGGAQRVVSILTQALTAYYDIYLILHDGRKVTYPYSGELIDLETPVANKKIKKVLNFIKRLFGLKEIKRTIKFDATISFMENSNFINLLTSVNDLLIISVRNYKSKQFNGLYGPVFKVLIKLLYKKSDLIVVPSTGIKNDLLKNFGLKKEMINVIHNPLDQAMIESMAGEDLDVEEAELFKTPVIIAIGSLIEQKGHRHLIRSFKMISERRHDVKLLIIGGGILKDELHKMIE